MLAKAKEQQDVVCESKVDECNVADHANATVRLQRVKIQELERELKSTQDELRGKLLIRDSNIFCEMMLFRKRFGIKRNAEFDERIAKCDFEKERESEKAKFGASESQDGTRQNAK